VTIAPQRLGHVVLKVRDLDRAEAFYAGVLGLTVTGRLPGRMVFFAAPGNPGSHDLAVYRVGPDAAPQGRDEVGLFHLAYQVESREALEQAYHHLRAHGVKITGTMNHGANLSVYFEDPDGHMLELTYEVPRGEWPSRANPFAGRDLLPFDEAARPRPGPAR